MGQVTPIHGEPTRFFVASRTRQEPWLVDLEEFGWNGQCGCEGFDMRMRKKLEQATERGQMIELLRCHHLQMAFAYAARHGLLPVDYKRG